MLLIDKQIAARALHAVLMALAPCGEASTMVCGGVFTVVAKGGAARACSKRSGQRSAAAKRAKRAS